jgi:hypothetical protein
MTPRRAGRTLMILCGVAALPLFSITLSGNTAPACAACFGMGCDGPVREAYIVCCNVPVYDAGKEGTGTDHSKDCRDYFRNHATPETRQSVCNQVKAQGLVCPATAGACDSPQGKYCGGNMPDKGFIFTSGSGNIYSEPFSNSSRVATAPRGGRLVYTRTTKTISGQTWYYVGVPGAAGVEGPVMAWIPGSEISCTRPQAPPTPRPTHVTPSNIPLSPSGGGLYGAGARG